MRDWTELFKDKLQGTRLTLPENDWEVMSGMLTRHIRRRRIQKGMFIVSSAAAILVAALILGHRQIQEDMTPERRIAGVEEESHADSNESVIYDAPETIPVRYPVGKSVLAEREPVEQESFDETPIYTMTQRDTSGKDSSVVDDSPVNNEEGRWTWVDAEETTRGKNILFGLSRSLLSSTILRSEPTSIIQNTTIIPDNAHHSDAETDENNPDNGDKDHIQAIIPGNQNMPMELNHTQYEHSYPYTLGISVGFPLSEKLFLTSGLDYSYCLSRITYSDNSKADQKAHYLGIPLHLDWIIIRNDKLSIYAGAGAEAYRCLFAQVGAYQRIKDRNIYYSAICLAGLKYEPVRGVGLFLEPQYSYSIPVKDPLIRSAITDSRDLFNVRAGISFRF
ncbi:MAG: hypothetical protein IKW89_01340 [Bacteroidales bacterium]|nr:hypothetical protein [Bacteroidales bacterium]